MQEDPKMEEKFNRTVKSKMSSKTISLKERIDQLKLLKSKQTTVESVEVTDSAEKMEQDVHHDHHEHGDNLDVAMDNVKLKKIYEVATILNNVESNPNIVVDKDYFKIKQFMIDMNPMFSDQFDCLSSMMLKKVVQNLKIKLYSKS